MNPALVSLATFVIVFGSAALAIRLSARLPSHHLNADSKDAVKLGMGLVATMSGLLLGLLVDSTKSSFDAKRTEITTMAAKIEFLDRTLASYGPGAASARQELKTSLSKLITRMWPKADAPLQEPGLTWTDQLPRAIHALPAGTDYQNAAKTEAEQVLVELGQIRWLIYEQSASSISVPLLVLLVIWLSVIFASIGLFAPWNPTVLGALMLAAAAVAGAIFLILELDLPFSGLIQISSRPMLSALGNISG
jgi:hypothetical protein